MSDLRIIIPTLNRPEDVLANVRSVIWACGHLSHSLEIELRLSENGSDESLRIEESELDDLDRSCVQNGLVFNYRYLKNRFSLGAHMHDLLSESGSEWQLWIGDDDVLSVEYMNTLLHLIKHDSEGCNIVFAAHGPVDRDCFLTRCSNSCKDIKRKSVLPYEKPSIEKNILRLAMRGHQLSGLLIRDSLIKECLINMNPENLYPWITLTAANLYKSGFIEVTSHEIFVTSDTPKLFSYGKDGLQGEIAEAILSIENVSEKTKMKLAREILSSRLSNSRMRNTGKTIFSISWNILCLINHPKIPTRIAVSSIPHCFRVLLTDLLIGFLYKFKFLRKLNGLRKSWRRKCS